MFKNKQLLLLFVAGSIFYSACKNNSSSSEDLNLPFPIEFQKVWQQNIDELELSGFHFDDADMYLWIFDDDPDGKCFINFKFAEYLSHNGNNFEILTYFDLPPETTNVQLFVSLDTLYFGAVQDTSFLKLIDAGISNKELVPNCNYKRPTPYLKNFLN